MSKQNAFEKLIVVIDSLSLIIFLPTRFFSGSKKTKIHDPYKAYELPERLSDLKLGNLRQCCHFLEDEMRKILNYRGKYRVYDFLKRYAFKYRRTVLIATVLMLKMDLDSIRFSSVFVRFFMFLLLCKKVCAFFRIFICPYPH